VSNFLPEHLERLRVETGELPVVNQIELHPYFSQVDAGETFGLSRWGLVRRVILPGALPNFLVGLRLALVGSWLIVIVAEEINAQSGIGYLIMQAQTTDRTDIMMMGLAIYAILGLLADALVRLLERRLLSWRRGFVGA
jgi:sulfonate transport system permease protein